MDAAHRADFEVRQLESIAGYPLIVLSRDGTDRKSVVFLSSGIHGDEPAGPLAILDLLRSDRLPRSLSWRIGPLLNPAGHAKGIRENRSGIDLNRDFKNPQSREIQAYREWICQQPMPDLSIAFHEDWEAAGFYLYTLSPRSPLALARRMLGEVSRIAPIETAKEIDGYAAEDGYIEPHRDKASLKDEPLWPEALFLYDRSPHLHFTLETPTRSSIADRVRMHLLAMEVFLASAVAGKLP